jgi:ketosteroid isomerase-like protein
MQCKSPSRDNLSGGSNEELIRAEKEFENLCSAKGLAEGFYFYADSNAVIKRGDEIIKGRENIRKFYDSISGNIQLSWTPDFVYVANDQDLAYTYGHYVYMDTAKSVRSTGIFHTVWKKQSNGTWRFVYD